MPGAFTFVVQAVQAIALLLLLMQNTQAEAATRRAVIIGINQYRMQKVDGRVTDLDGALNDADAMADTLRNFHGFLEKDILILRDQEATREAILRAINQRLIEPAQPGDISLFFYAGHGSYVENPSSTERDRRDETIVPADSQRGAPDIRDKELAQRFNQVIDKKAQLIAIFDSCHSGSIARWVELAPKSRAVPPVIETRALNIPANIPAPEQRGALILSATIDQQPAQEKRIRGTPRGRFTSALEQILKSPFRDESVEEIFMRVRALMQAGGSIQEPTLATTQTRRRQTMWGMPVASLGSGQLAVSVVRVTSTMIHLQAGYAIGLGEQAELTKKASAKVIRLRVREVTGMSTSKAEILEGALEDIKHGDLFLVTNFGVPTVDELRVFISTEAPSQKQWMSSVQVLRRLAQDNRIVWVADPAESKVTHVVTYTGGQWVLSNDTGQHWPLGATIKPAALLQRLSKIAKPRLFVNLPVPAEVRATLINALRKTQGFVQITDEGTSCDYSLVGRLSMSAGGVEFAWVAADAQAGARPGTLPTRGTWTAATDSLLSSILQEDARRLARIKVWQLIEPPVEETPFPYHLAVQELGTERTLPPNSPLQGGHNYQLLLLSDGTPKPMKPHYIYVFNIDREGNSSLLVPASGAGNVENVIPDMRDRSKPPAQRIPIGPGFSVGVPYGRDTIVMVTSLTAIPDPDVFQFSAAQRSVKASGPSGDALVQFLFGLNTGTRANQPVPATWSIQRMVVESVAP